MSEIIKYITELWAIWAPSVTSIAATVATLFIAINKTNEVINSLKDNEEFKELKTALKKSLKDNETLKQQNDILIDELKKIKDYRENMQR